MEKNNGKVCGICDKFFSSGKAMGGHMRSHLVKLPIPPKPETENQALDNSADLTLRPIQSDYSLNFRSMKRNFSVFSENSKRENESVSYPKNPTHKRYNYHRKFNETEIHQGVWVFWAFLKEVYRREEVKRQKINETNIMKAEDNEGSGDDSLVQAHPQARFKCGTCGQMFQSYQALGIHKANHGGYSGDDKGDNDGDFIIDQKPFPCSYCNRVFESGQALGGHMKVHKSQSNCGHLKT